MDDLTIARALHVLAIVHWIGGVSLVSLVLLPGLQRAVAPSERLALLEAIEGRFSRQAPFFDAARRRKRFLYDPQTSSLAAHSRWVLLVDASHASSLADFYGRSFYRQAAGVARVVP